MLFQQTHNSTGLFPVVAVELLALLSWANAHGRLKQGSPNDFSVRVSHARKEQAGCWAPLAIYFLLGTWRGLRLALRDGSSAILRNSLELLPDYAALFPRGLCFVLLT
jgi:hypothetical protein